MTESKVDALLCSVFYVEVKAKSKATIYFLI